MLALGVEKMWTGDRAETIAGIEDGLPAEYRHDLHDRRHADDNPAGSILMGLNNGWAQRLMAEVGRHRAPDRRRGRQGLRARGTQPPGPVPAARDHRRGARLPPGGRRPDPAHVQLVHRRRGRRRAGRPVGPGPGRGAPYHRLGGALRKRLDRLPRPPRPRPPTRPGRPSASAPTTPTCSSCTTPRRPRSSTPSSRSASSLRVRPDRPPRRAPPAWTRPGSWSTPSGGLVGRGHPLGRHRPGAGGRAGHAVPGPGR